MSVRRSPSLKEQRKRGEGRGPSGFPKHRRRPAGDPRKVVPQSVWQTGKTNPSGNKKRSKRKSVNQGKVKKNKQKQKRFLPKRQPVNKSKQVSKSRNNQVSLYDQFMRLPTSKKWGYTATACAALAGLYLLYKEFRTNTISYVPRVSSRLERRVSNYRPISYKMPTAQQNEIFLKRLYDFSKSYTNERDANYIVGLARSALANPRYVWNLRELTIEFRDWHRDRSLFVFYESGISDLKAARAVADKTPHGYEILLTLASYVKDKTKEEKDILRSTN